MASFDDLSFVWDSTASGGGETVTLSPGWRRADPPAEPQPMSLEAFRAAVEEELDLLPPYCFDELSGGVLVEDRARLSPDSVADDLYILGLYRWNQLGKQVTLYYGSFVAVLGQAEERAYRDQIRETLRHEFRHHMETRAGEFGKGSLIEEDERRREAYFQARRGQVGRGRER